MALPAVERLALGRAVLAPTLDGCDPGPELYRATVLTAADYLTCAATVSHCRDGWLAAIRKVFDAARCTAPDLAGERTGPRRSSARRPWPGSGSRWN